ncbi:uncharacterized protein HMPREF1541_05919 [Cyphellophora europaea CBS 101466]|uniref:Integral membrane protein n=1 Tax=Cyphellophora europaea (strain CBS 101466) TaxID=1220924 RepID=W2RV89_CYPE1|nr:uncharacterized protein HMPREF1541_05919 [Cyphellophora europaea CBS 101466]ETN39693.1 hypothetical protein HMPREF1541_05919 [Cyphellophora europaea CBS 101466]
MAPNKTPLSQSTVVLVAANVVGMIWIGFGIFDLINPVEGLTFFEFKPPVLPAEQAMVNSLIYVIGIRDIFIGFAIHATAYFGNRTTLAWIMLAASAEAFLDGAVCYANGKGEWNHWGYAPMLTVVGLLLLGLFDGSKK